MIAVYVVIVIILVYLYMSRRRDNMRCKGPNIMTVAASRIKDLPANADAQFYMDLERQEIAPCMDDFAELSHIKKKNNTATSLRSHGEDNSNVLESRGVQCGGRGIYCARRPRF